MKKLLLVMMLGFFPILAAEDLRLVTFNIRYAANGDRGERSWKERRDLVVTTIQNMKPDFLGVQEALDEQVRDLARDLREYDRFGVGRDDGRKAGEYSVIFYRKDRFRLDAKSRGTFWLSDTPDKPGSKSWGNQITRICTWGRFLEKETGRGLFLYNTHWDHQSQPAREGAARLIREHLQKRVPADEPVVLLGDFNAVETSAELRVLTEGEGALRNSFLVANPDEKERGTFNAWNPQATTGGMIDHILLSPSFELRESRIVRDHRGTQVPSDHFPVLTVVQW